MFLSSLTVIIKMLLDPDYNHNKLLWLDVVLKLPPLVTVSKPIFSSPLILSHELLFSHKDVMEVVNTKCKAKTTNDVHIATGGCVHCEFILVLFIVLEVITAQFIKSPFIN